MAQPSSWRLRAAQCLPAAYFAVLPHFVYAVTFVPRHTPFNPDEARIVILLRDLAGWFPAESWIRATHLLAQVDYYLLAQAFTVTPGLLQLVAALHMVAAFVYLAWLSSAYGLIRGTGLLVLCVLFATNGAIHQFGTWGVFDYAQRILISLCLVHVLLALSRGTPGTPGRSVALITLLSLPADIRRRRWVSRDTSST